MVGFIVAIIVLIGGIVVAGMIDKREAPGLKILIPVVSIIVAAVLVIGSCVSYVPTGYTGILTTFGRVEDNTLDAGVAFHFPWQNVVKMDNREQRDAFQLEAFSKDIQQVGIQGSVNYNIDKSTAMRLYRDVGTEYVPILVNPRIQEDVKIVIAKYTAENLVANRQAMSDEIFNLLKSELIEKGVNIISLAIENIDFTDQYESAIEAKQVATQEKQRAQTQQEQQTMEATQKAERDRIAAQAAADVAKIEADAKAYAIQVEAEAKAEANKKMNQSLTQELIEYTKINAWNGQLPQFTGGGTPIINFTKEGE